MACPEPNVVQGAISTVFTFAFLLFTFFRSPAVLQNQSRAAVPQFCILTFNF